MGKQVPMVLPIIACIIAQITLGGVSTRVYLADSNTPLELADPNIPFVYRDIMVGTKLAIVISSDVNGYWGGDLAIAGEDLNYGLLSARDFNEITRDWAGSRFPAAGDTAQVVSWIEDSGVQGFSFEGHRTAVAGDWFIIDYTAISLGVCNVAFYDRSVSWIESLYYLTFSHVPTRDFDSDTKVNFVDFAVFASHWRLTDCDDPNMYKGADLDSNDNVDSRDLILFSEYWLESTR